MAIEFYSIIYTIVFQLMFVPRFYFLYRNWLRFSLTSTIIIAALIYGFDFLACHLPLFSEAGWLPTITSSFIILMHITLVRKECIADALIIYEMFDLVFNVGATALMAALSFIYSRISGQSSETWYITDTATPADFIMRTICVIAGTAFGLIICRKCIPVLQSVRSRLKLMLCMGFVLPILLFITFSRIFITDSQQYLSGSFVIAYGILIIVTTVSLFIFFVSVFIQTKENNRLMQTRIESQNMHYHRVLKAQQELREAKHDLANRLAAYSIAQTNRDR